MTNGWVDIKNADVILAWAATPPRIIPAVSSGPSRRRRRATRRSSSVDPRFTRTAAVADLYSPIRAGHGHRLSPRHHPLRHREQPLPRGLRQAPHQRVAADRPEVRVRRRALLGLRRGDRHLRQGTWAYQPDAKTGREDRPDAAEPALRLPAPEEARRPLHARDGRTDLRHAEGHLPQGLRDRDLDRQRPASGERSRTRSDGRSTRPACR